MAGVGQARTGEIYRRREGGGGSYGQEGGGGGQWYVAIFRLRAGGMNVLGMFQRRSQESIIGVEEYNIAMNNEKMGDRFRVGVVVGVAEGVDV